MTQPETLAHLDGGTCGPLTMSVGISIARFDRQRQEQHGGLGRHEIVGVLLDPHK